MKLPKSNVDFSTKSDIENLINKSLDTPEVTRRLRSGSQMLYKGTPVKFLGRDNSGSYKIAILNRDSGEWIPKLVTHEEYTRLRNSKHRIFKYNFSIKLNRSFNK